jgi:RHS repeat-associated protein
MAAGAPAGSYSLSDLDDVNLFSGNLSFAIPLIKIGGRGSAGYTMTLRPNENRFHWRVIHQIQRTCGQYGCTITGHTYFPSINWWASFASQPGYSPGVVVGRKSGINPTQPGGCPNGTSVWSSTLTRISFITGDGTEYELRDQLLAGQPQNLPDGTCGGQAGLRGKVWFTADGTALTFISDVNIYDHSTNPETFYPSGYILFRDGTRYRIENGAVSWIRDRNGNQVTFSGGTITDSLKRTVTLSADTITFKGFSGATRTIQVSHTSLDAALRPCRPDPGYQCFSIQTYKQLFPASDGSSVTQFNPSVVSAATLPDGRQYRFYYNSYAELARVDLPTGGVIEYDYAAGAGADSSGLTSAYVNDSTEKAIYRRVVERRIYADGVNLESRTTYSNDVNPMVIDHLKPTGELISREKHYFYGDPRTTFFLSSVSYEGWNDGREYKTQLLSNDGTTELRRVENSWQQGCTVSPWSTLIPNNPRIADITSTLEPSSSNKVSKEVFNYDCYNNLTDKYEYDFGTGAPAANYTRRTHTDYLTINPVNGASYDTLNPSPSNPDINASFHLRNLPSQTSVYDIAGEKQRTSFEYDSYVVAANHNTLIPRSNITLICTVILSPTSCDNSNNTGYTKRGNVTATTSTVFVNGSSTGSISAFNQFDIAGNVVKVIDVLGNASTFLYDDVFGVPNNNARLNTPPTELAGAQTYAFPTTITNALGHSMYAKYDYYLGKPVNGEDANGVIASGSFNDLLDRPTQIRRGIGTDAENQTTFAYDDVNRIITTSSDRDAVNDNLLISKVFYDQMGRTTETRQYEGSDHFIAVQTQYDALGRSFKTSYPFRPWKSESAVWTIQAFDSLGRVISVTTPADNAVVTTNYSGNSVTVTDQAGKRRKSVTDALGRLTDVLEDPQPENPTGLNYQTSYTYDVLNDLVKVTQGSQQRFFMYDSLKRLLRARNPEQGTHSSLNLSDSLTGNSTWSLGYQYDAAGNLTQKTDARETGAGPLTSTYTYDALNRNTEINYSDTPINPDVKRFYDGATGGKGRFWYSYKGGDYSNGSNVEHTAIDSYDALGRPLVQRQLFKLNNVWSSSSYQISRTYNRAGGVVLQKYPSWHDVSYTYDDAGRTASFSGYLGDNVQRTYSNSIEYASVGGLSREQFGTDTLLYHKAFYNIRGQLSDTRLSSVNDTWDWNRGRLILYYSSNHVWGQSGSDNNGNVWFAETWIPLGAGFDQADTLFEEAYSYDSLNRLTSIVDQKTSVATGWGNWQQQFRQQYSYDRYGNRTIDAAQTWGTGINNKQFTVENTTNRLLVPNGQTGVMSYDAAGNLINDTYTGAGAREYDAENKMTRAWGGNNQWQEYTYNADGQRTRRKINGSETWQIYGMDGELLAEYSANGATNAPQKEYGYRNGELLVTASPGSGDQSLNLNGTAYVQVPNSSSLNISGAITVEAWIKVNAITGAFQDIISRESWNQAGTGGGFELSVTNSGKLRLDTYQSPTAYTPLVGGITITAGVWHHVAAVFDGSQVRLYVDGVMDTTLSTTNGPASGTSSLKIGRASYAGTNFGGLIDEARVSNSAVYTSNFTPSTHLTASSSTKGLWKFDGQSVADSSGNGNDGTLQGATYSTDVPSGGGGSSSAQVQWLVSDHLGTPRMIVDQIGTLANVKRHDYLPFGEELFAPAGGRTTSLGYTTVGDGVRHQFTQKERDIETGLDYFEARFYGSTQGRFTSPDPLLMSGIPIEPQSWNRYSYCLNKPLSHVDPDGLIWETQTTVKGNVSTTVYKWVWQDTAEKDWDPVTDFWVDIVGPDGQTIGLRMNPNGPNSFLQNFLAEDPILGMFVYTDDYHVKGYEYTPSSEDRRRNSGIDMMPNQAIEVGLAVGGLRGTGEVASAGVSMEGKAYELGLLSRHLPGTAAATRAVAKDQLGAFVFKDLSTLSRVEAQIFARGEYTGTVRQWERFGVRFDEQIGTQIRKDGTTTALHYGEMKIRSNGLYHIAPRTGPAK